MSASPDIWPQLPPSRSPANAVAAPLGRPLAGDGLIETDGELLRLFTRHGDAAAFDKLVERHSAMVWRVCRQTLRRRQDAEDAFQATFLLLVKSGRQIGASESAAGWLFRVAYRTSLRARKRLASRREEALALDPTAPTETPFPDLTTRQHLGVLAEELMALPLRYQTPLVMRYIEGQSRRAIAEATDVTVATVQGRLARGKQLLRRRLVRRGVTLSVAVGVLSSNPRAEAAAASTQLVLQTTTNATAIATGGSLAASVAVITLIEQGTRAMLFASLTKPAAFATACGLAALVLAAPPVEQPTATASEGVVLTVTVEGDEAEAPTATLQLAADQPTSDREPEALAPGGEAAEEPPQVTATLQAANDPPEVTGTVQPSDASLNLGFGDMALNGRKLTDAEQNEALRKQWAEAAKKDPPPMDNEPSFKELHTWRSYWEYQRNALRQRAQEMSLMGRLGEGTATQVDIQLVAADIYKAHAEMLRYERELKLRALKDSEPGASATGVEAAKGLTASTPLLSPGSRVRIDVVGALNDAPIDDVFTVEPQGTIALGPQYGRVKVAGMDVIAAEAAVRTQLANVLENPLVQVVAEPEAPAMDPLLEWKTITERQLMNPSGYGLSREDAQWYRDEVMPNRHDSLRATIKIHPDANPADVWEAWVDRQLDDKEREVRVISAMIRNREAGVVKKGSQTSETKPSSHDLQIDEIRGLIRKLGIDWSPKVDLSDAELLAAWNSPSFASLPQQERLKATLSAVFQKHFANPTIVKGEPGASATGGEAASGVIAGQPSPQTSPANRRLMSPQPEPTTAEYYLDDLLTGDAKSDPSAIRKLADELGKGLDIDPALVRVNDKHRSIVVVATKQQHQQLAARIESLTPDWKTAVINAARDPNGAGLSREDAQWYVDDFLPNRIESFRATARVNQGADPIAIWEAWIDRNPADKDREIRVITALLRNVEKRDTSRSRRTAESTSPPTEASLTGAPPPPADMDSLLESATQKLRTLTLPARRSMSAAALEKDPYGPRLSKQEAEQQVAAAAAEVREQIAALEQAESVVRGQSQGDDRSLQMLAQLESAIAQMKGQLAATKEQKAKDVFRAAPVPVPAKIEFRLPELEPALQELETLRQQNQMLRAELAAMRLQLKQTEVESTKELFRKKLDLAPKPYEQPQQPRVKPLDGASSLLPLDKSGRPGRYAATNEAYGYSVQQLQARLNEVLDPSPKLDVDGDYGPKTTAAVKQFQTWRGLKPSGFADKETLWALGYRDAMPAPQATTIESKMWQRVPATPPVPAVPATKSLPAVPSLPAAPPNPVTKPSPIPTPSVPNAPPVTPPSAEVEESGDAETYFNAPPLFTPRKSAGIALVPPKPDGARIKYAKRNSEYGWSVLQLQERLNEVLQPSTPLRVDGDYGPLTEAAVKEFQRLRELPVTGDVDARTREALGFVEPANAAIQSTKAAQ